MKDKEKTELILKYLTDYHTSWGRERTNILFPELRLGSGYCGVAQRRIDLFVISSNAGNETTAFEIKVSRQDFKKDVSNELKQRGARLYSNKFYYVTPKGLLKPEEIPIWAGLWEIDLEESKEPKYHREIVPAPLHSRAMPSWGLICSMMRHVNKDLGKDPDQINNLKREIRQLKEQNKKDHSLLLRVASTYEQEYDSMLWLSLASYRSEWEFEQRMKEC